MAPGGGCHLFSGCGFPSPGLQSFDFKPLFSIGSFPFTKPMLIALLCAAAVIVFFWAAFAKPKLVPPGVQNIGEIPLPALPDRIPRPSPGPCGATSPPVLGPSL